MKYRNFLFLLVLALASTVSAKVVSQAEALQVATTFFNSGNAVQTLSGTPALKEIWNSNSLSQGDINLLSNETPTFYVFAPEAGKGFVIVSAEDAMTPILGYSFEDDAPEGELPCNLKMWFEVMHNRITQIRTEGETATNEVKQQWARASAMKEVFIVETAKWDQSEPYNRQCPLYGGSRCVTGCVQTALAIIMRYHLWPKRGYGKTETYVTSTYGIKVESRSLEHEYDWDNMPLEYSYGQYTDEEAYAVSTLMADVGYLIKADYGTGATSNSESNIINNKFYEHFDYSSTMYSSSKSSYSDDEWLLLLKNELRKNGPVFYRGTQPGYWTGHAFVLDGYTDDDYFHINWGWSGSSNGFFLLAEIDYSNAQGALFNFKPNDGSEAISTLCEDAESMLDAVWRNITTNYADVADNYAASYEFLSDELDNIHQETEGALTEDEAENIKERIGEITEEINDMLASARTSFETGVKGIGTERDEKVSIYDITGRRVRSMQKGSIYIYKYSDGTARKVLVK